MMVQEVVFNSAGISIRGYPLFTRCSLNTLVLGWITLKMLHIKYVQVEALTGLQECCWCGRLLRSLHKAKVLPQVYCQNLHFTLYLGDSVSSSPTSINTCVSSSKARPGRRGTLTYFRALSSPGEEERGLHSSPASTPFRVEVSS